MTLAMAHAGMCLLRQSDMAKRGSAASAGAVEAASSLIGNMEIDVEHDHDATKWWLLVLQVVAFFFQSPVAAGSAAGAASTAGRASAWSPSDDEGKSWAAHMS